MLSKMYKGGLTLTLLVVSTLVATPVCAEDPKTDPTMGQRFEQGKERAAEIIQLSQEQIQQIVGSPAVQFVLRMASNEKISGGVTLLKEQSDTKKFFIAVLLFSIFYFAVKSWFIPSTDNWFQRFFKQWLATAFYWTGTSFVIPLAVFGEGYRDLLEGLFQVLRPYLNLSGF